MAKTGPKGPRNKVKQVLLLEGHPDCIFTVIEQTTYTAVRGTTVIPLGKIRKAIVDLIQEIPGIEIQENIHKARRATNLPGILNVKTTPSSTMLTVGADSEENLGTTISSLKEYFDKNNVQVTERCHWVCEFDKKDVPTKDVPIQEDIKIEPVITNKEKGPARPMKEKTKKLQEMAIRMGVQ